MKRYKIENNYIYWHYEDENGEWVKYEDMIRLIKDEMEEWNDDSRDKLSDGAIYGLDRLLHLIERD